MPFRECIPRVQAWQRNLAGIDGDTAEDHAAEDIASVRRAERGTAVRDNCVSDNNPEIGCPVTEPMPKEKWADVSVEKCPVCGGPSLTVTERMVIECVIGIVGPGGIESTLSRLLERTRDVSK